MAAQRVVLLKVIGESGRLVAERCRAWAARQQTSPDDPELRKKIGRFAEVLDAHRTDLPVVYYSEWLDRWSMGDDFAKPFTARGGVALVPVGRFSDVYITDRPADMLTLPADGWQFDEQALLATRLRELAVEWEQLVEDGVIVLLRQVIGASTDDEEITATMANTPEWLAERITPL